MKIRLFFMTIISFLLVSLMLVFNPTPSLVSTGIAQARSKTILIGEYDLSKKAIPLIGYTETMRIRLYGTEGRSKWRLKKIVYKLTKHTSDISFRDFQVRTTGKKRGKTIYEKDNIDKNGSSEVGWVSKRIHKSIRKGSEVSLSVRIRANHAYKFVRL